MKIAIDIRTAAGERAGKGWYTFNLVQHLLKLDKQNEYILYSKGKVAGLHDLKNAEIREVGGRGFFWHLKVARDVYKERADIFFSPSSYITPSFIKNPTRVVFTVHDLVAFLFSKSHNRKATIIEKLFLKRALKRADHVLSVSDHTKQDLLKLFPDEKTKISIIPCAAADRFQVISAEEKIAFRKKEKLPSKFFLAVGTLLPRKNYLRLLRAFSTVAAADDDIRLIIVGGPGWKYQEIFEECERLFLQKKVQFWGYSTSDELVGLYNSALALVFPSLYEGFGIPPLEAMKCGCPVIASNSSSIPEVVGDAALLIDPKDVKGWSGAMLLLLQDAERRQELIEAGLKQAKNFSWQESAARLLPIFSPSA